MTFLPSMKTKMMTRNIAGVGVCSISPSRVQLNYVSTATLAFSVFERFGECGSQKRNKSVPVWSRCLGNFNCALRVVISF